MKRRHRSLQFFLSSYGFLFALTIVVLLGAFSTLFFINDTKRLVLSHMTALASIKREKLDRWVEQRVEEYEYLTASLNYSRKLVDFMDSIGTGNESEAMDDLSDYFELILTYHPDISAVDLMTDPGGKIIYSSQSGIIGEYQVTARYFTEGKRKVYVQNVYPSPVTVKPRMTISGPVYESVGRRIGVLAVHLNLDEMDEMVSDGAGLGKTGVSYLVDRYNSIVSSTRFDTSMYPRGVHSHGIDSAVRGESGAGIYRNQHAKRVIGIYQWIEEREVALLVEMEVSEAYRSARNQALFISIIGVALIVALRGAVYVIAKHLSKPIVDLRDAVFNVANGQLGTLVPIPRVDELAGLANSFNDMTLHLRGLYEELRMKEEYYRSLIENSSDIVLIIKTDGTILFISPAVEHYLDYPTEAMIGTNVFDLLHPEDIEDIKQNDFHRLLNKNDYDENMPTRRPSIVTLRIRHNDSTWRVFEVVAKNLTSHPAVRGLVLNCRDITERSELEERLNQAHKLEAVGRLAGGIAHDFNNILTAIIGNADMIRLENQLEGATDEYLSQIRSSAKRAANLTQQLLAYSRKQVLKPQVIDLNELITSITGILRRLIGEDARIIVDLAEDLRPVRIDPSQMEQVIMNLAINARDAIPNGGSITFTTRNVVNTPSLRATAHLDVDVEYVEFSVKDDGGGMSDSVKSKIFDPFFTTKDVGKGTGLGLSTVLGIVKQSDGHIEVQTSVGAGSIFSVYLPCYEGAPVASRVEEEQIELRAGKVLVVEDEDAVRKMIEQVLLRNRFQVLSASNAPDALELFRNNKDDLDLVITDLVMPNGNGYELSLEIDKIVPGFTVLFMSGYAEFSLADGNIDFNSNRFLKKPFSPIDLLKRVSYLISQE